MSVPREEAIKSTSFPGSSLFLPQESTLVEAGHVPVNYWSRACVSKSNPVFDLILSTLVNVALPYRRYFES